LLGSNDDRAATHSDQIRIVVTVLVIGNSRTEEMVGDLAALTSEELRAGGCAAQRSLWFAGDGDVVVLPWLPRAEYLAYVTGLTGTDPDSLAIVAPPPGTLGVDLLTPDRTSDPDFRAQLRAALRGRDVDHVLAVYKDPPTVELACAVGLGPAVPGHLFSAQDGDALVNSKAVFRAVAAAAGVPIPPGVVTAQPGRAEVAIADLLAEGDSVIVKQEFQSGGFGNEILSPAAGMRVAGAPTMVVLPDGPSVSGYLARRWEWLTAGGRHRLVVERYLPGCDTVYAEYVVGDRGEELLGTGELLMEPVAVGEVVPAQALTDAGRATLVDAGRRLCRAYGAIGYRGFLSTDAVLTPAGEIVFTETNGRLSGSTHLHTVVRARLVAEEHRERRVLLERRGWAVPSFSAALERLTGAGLGYDQHTSTGVVLTGDRTPDGTLTYCVVAEDLATARATADRLTALFTVAESLDSGALSP
jgi:hypothetical protein